MDLRTTLEGYRRKAKGESKEKDQALSLKFIIMSHE